MSGERVGATREGAARWLSVHDDLLRGLTHALSNRLGTVAAASYLLDQQPTAVNTAAVTLRAESERLEALLHLIRLLPYPDGAVAEPVIPTDATTQALALQAHHPDLRDIPVTVTLDGDVQPAYVSPAALVMAVAVVVGAAQRVAGGDGRVELIVSSDTETVRVVARGQREDGGIGEPDAMMARDIDAVTWLLTPYRGHGEGADGGVMAIVPTLQAARRARLE